MRQSPPVPTISNASSSIRRFISQKTPRVHLCNLAASGTRRRQWLKPGKHRANFENTADPRDRRDRRAIRVYQTLHKHQAAGGAQDLRLALHPGAQRRGTQIIDLQIDGGQKAAVKVFVEHHRRHRQHVAKRRRQTSANIPTASHTEILTLPYFYNNLMLFAPKIIKN